VRLGSVEEIPPGEGRTYDVGPTSIAVFRLRDGGVRAVQAACPHAGGPLADGQIDRQVVICPLHLHVFDLTTGCAKTGQPDLRTYPVHLDDEGYVVLSIEELAQ
jgi:nitrite reductase/ring-hydroxylating ferredoxin subunit